MKNLVILIALILIVAFTSQAESATKKIVGELVNEGDQIAVYTLDGRVALHTDQLVDDCFDGEYEVALEPKGEAIFKLVETLFCRGKARGFGARGSLEKTNEMNEKNAFCPMIYAPVCGSINGIPNTFGNSCELENAKAKKLFLGECEQALGMGVKIHQDVHPIEIFF